LHPKGYCDRLFAQFEAAPLVYRRLSISVEEAGVSRSEKARTEIPAMQYKKTPLMLPYAYLLVKKKCLSSNGTWGCVRPHEHERTSVATPRDFLGKYMAKAARACKTVVKAANLLSWPVANQTRL
jgi:hypothetical protein